MCLSCGGGLPPDAVICVHCGLDLRTGEALSTRVEAEPSALPRTAFVPSTTKRGGRPTLLWVYAIPNIVLPVLILASIATVVLVPARVAQSIGGKDLVVLLSAVFFFPALALVAILSTWLIMGIALCRGRKWGLWGLAVLFIPSAVFGAFCFATERSAAQAGTIVLVYIGAHVPLFLSRTVRRYVS